MHYPAWVTFFVAALITVGCGADEPVWECTPERPVSYAEVEQLFADRCTSCHAGTKTGGARQGAPDGSDLDSYQGVASFAKRSAKLMDNGAMPPSGRLSALDRTMFSCWIEQGLTP